MATILDTAADGSLLTYREQEGKILIEQHHPDASVVEKLNAEQMAARGRFSKKGDFHHVMRIPQAVLTKICADTGLDFFNPDDAKKILKILKGPEYRAFRTYEGQI